MMDKCKGVSRMEHGQQQTQGTDQYESESRRTALFNNEHRAVVLSQLELRIQAEPMIRP